MPRNARKNGKAGRPAKPAVTQTVFGEGPQGAEIMMVGEQPGDVEDREGHPGVGLKAATGREERERGRGRRPR
jgi:uracil-DNA glycosylase